MRRAAALTVLGATILVLAWLVGFALPSSLARAQDNGVTLDVAIDVDTLGNGDHVLGTTEACNGTPLAIGETIDVDIVVRGVPAFDGISVTGDLQGTDFDLLFNPSVVQVNTIHGFVGPTIFDAGDVTIPFESFDYHGGPPGTTGDVAIGMADLAPYIIHYGDGVLTRVTLEAVGTGTSRLDLTYTLAAKDSPQLYGAPASQFIYPINEDDATIVVDDGSCAPPTPTTYPRTPSSPTPTRSPSPTPSLTASPTRSATPTAAPTTATASPSRTATPMAAGSGTVLPSTLPRTGGEPGGGASLPVPIGVAGAVVMGAAITAFVVARRRV